MIDLDIKNLPETITIDVYPYYHAKYGWTGVTEDKPHGELMPIGDPVTVTFALTSSKDAANKAVKCLREDQANIRAESERKCMVLENKIQTFLALEAPGD